MNKKQIGDYTIVKQIGQGTLGTVFLAEHRFLKKNYALKVFPEELSLDKQFSVRFEKEFPKLANLEHPHIVKIHQASFFEGVYFVATDCVLGPEGTVMNLEQYCDTHELNEEEIFSIAEQIASSLDYAHQKLDGGIAHLSLKLQNILVSVQNGKVNAHLFDYGLAPVVGTGVLLSRMYKTISEALASRLESTSLTKIQRSFLSSYLFLAPEQKVLGDETKVSSKSDAYAFGVILYYLLTKKLPDGVFEFPCQMNPNYKFHWDTLLQQLMHFSPEKRPKSLLEAVELAIPRKGFGFTGNISLSEPGTVKASTLQDVLKPVIKPTEIKRPEFIADPRVAFQIDPTIGRYETKTPEMKVIEPLHTDMTVIRGGSFARGSNQGSRDEMPRHNIELSDFAIDVHPVTNEQFVLFLEAMGGEKDENNLDMIRLRDSRIKRVGGKISIESGYAKHPVVGVAWYGAVAYAKWVGKRLPSEAEWEIAAAGKLADAVFPTGSTLERTQANFFSSDTSIVMSYPPNDYGLFDMAGNVYEWCNDWYEFHYYDISIQEPNNPKGPLQGVYRVLRGGCWKSLKEDLRVSHRHRNNPGTMNGTYGFRCAADVGFN